MTEFFKFATSNLWVFLGVCIIGNAFLNTFLIMVGEIIKGINVNKYGWPPAEQEHLHD
jgi:hypothetical protein